MEYADLAGAPTMPKHVYVDLYVRICKVLLEQDEEWNEEEATRIIGEAWSEDSRGQPSMTRTVFNDSLFE